MRLAFVSWRELAHPQAGGSELVIDRLATGLMARGHEVALMCGGPTGARPYPVVDIGGTYTQYLRAPIAHARRFRQWDLLVDVENGVPFFSPWWRGGPSLLLVHHVHTAQWALRFRRPMAAFGRHMESVRMPRAYRERLVVAASDSTAQALTHELGVPAERVRSITWGVDRIDGPLPGEADEPRFIALGRLVPHKRVDLILRAWQRVRPRVGGTLVVVGEGPEQGALHRMAGEGVVFTGRVDEREKLRLLGRSWLLVHAARHEGWGVVVMEAAMAGRPTVAVDAAGIRDAVVDGTTGLLAADEDELVEQWVRLALDPAERLTMGEQARRRALGMTWERTVLDFEAIAFEAVGAARPVTSEAA